MLYNILRRIKGQVNIMMWLTIILALVIVSGVYTYARYTYHSEVTGVTVTVPGIGYCAYNGMTLADCVLVTDADEPYETVSAAKTEIEQKGDPDFNEMAPIATILNYTDNLPTRITTVTASSRSMSSYSSRYYTYADDYEFDEETGKYSLVNAQVGQYSSIYSELVGKYVVSFIGSTSESAATSTDLSTIYYITDETTESTLKYIASAKTTNYEYDYSGDGLYAAEDDYGTSYYYRGAIENNYVEYAGYVWRIIRVNGDGSVRMIYDGTSAHANGEDSEDRYYTTSAFNESYNDNAYVGYMYGTAGSSTYDATHENKNSSTIKTVLDTFYEEKLDSTETTDRAGNIYSDYLSDTLFCNDRSLSSGTGIGKTTTNYSVLDRLQTSITPVLTCTNQNDEFTVKTTTLEDDTEVGNAALTYPIGLITADEVIMAGGVNSSPGHYLYMGSFFWSMTPYAFDASLAYEIETNKDATNGGGAVSNSVGVRPVVNLSSDVYVYSGTGTQDDPYHVSLTKRVDTGCNGELSCEMLLNSTGEKTVSAAESAIEEKGTPNFSSTATTDEGLYATEDDYGTSYYYRGAVEDNYVSFAGYIWRIIRRNGDGSVRLIYDGTEAHENGESNDDRQIGVSQFNSKYYDPTYVGYVYGENLIFQNATDSTNYYNFTNTTTYYFSDSYTCNDSTNTCSLDGKMYQTSMNEGYEKIISDYPYTCFLTSSTDTCYQVKEILSYTSGNTYAKAKYHGYFSSSYEDIREDDNSSTIKTTVDNWYYTNILNKYDTDGNSYNDYVADTTFCSDRTISTTSAWNIPTMNIDTMFEGYRRMISAYSPTLECENTEDMLTVSSGKLTYPVGLIMIDEASFAGGKYNTYNNLYYLYTGQNYWTISPANFDTDTGFSHVWYVYSNGFLDRWYAVTESYGVRPVINISSSVLVESGTGTQDDPYLLKLSN